MVGFRWRRAQAWRAVRAREEWLARGVLRPAVLRTKPTDSLLFISACEPSVRPTSTLDSHRMAISNMPARAPSGRAVKVIPPLSEHTGMPVVRQAPRRWPAGGAAAVPANGADPPASLFFSMEGVSAATPEDPADSSADGITQAVLLTRQTLARLLTPDGPMVRHAVQYPSGASYLPRPLHVCRAEPSCVTPTHHLPRHVPPPPPPQLLTSALAAAVAAHPGDLEGVGAALLRMGGSIQGVRMCTSAGGTLRSLKHSFLLVDTGRGGCGGLVPGTARGLPLVAAAPAPASPNPHLPTWSPHPTPQPPTPHPAQASRWWWTPPLPPPLPSPPRRLATPPCWPRCRPCWRHR